jgi:hypothetical protein
METTVLNTVEYTYNVKSLDEKVTKTVENIEKYIKENNYRVTGDIEEYYVLEGWKNLSKNQMKQIQKYCFWIERKPTLRRINSFFSLLSRLFGIKKVNVLVSLKEEKIQKTRKEWLKARQISDNLLAEYKKEKGDFYKNNLLIK